MADVEEQTPSGAIRKVRKELKTVGAYKLKQTSRVWTSDNYRAKEEFDKAGIRFKVRSQRVIEEAEYARYRGVLYRIVMTDYNIADDTFTLYLEKKDE